MAYRTFGTQLSLTAAPRVYERDYFKLLSEEKPVKITAEIYECALSHLVKHGDTDVFPHPIELKFLRDSSASAIAALTSLDLTQYHPMGVIESLVPKTKYGFRVAHQSFPVDTLILTSMIYDVYDSIEAGRDPVSKRRAFSYRKAAGLNDDLFIERHSYGQWITAQQSKLFSDDFSHAVRTDISDFYLRIYRHRLENIVSSLSGRVDAAKRIERFISAWRGGQSFGIPVGTNAARLLAEAALNDTDTALISENIEFTRYVDDFVLYIKHGDDPYAALAFLAGHLATNEGLSLNSQKTKVLEWSEYIASIEEPNPEDEKSSAEFATEKLFWVAYGQDELAQEALEALMMKDLRKELEELLSGEYWDMGRIKVVLHAMRIVRNSDVADYIRNNLGTLIPFSKDVFFLIQEFVAAEVSGFENMAEEIVELLLSPRMKPLDCARAWLLELGVRKVVYFDQSAIRRLEAGLSGTLDLRQLNLLRWRISDQNYFRSKKSRVSEMPPWVQPSFIFGASCLPRDEYYHWVRSIKNTLHFPLGKEFAEWCLASYGKELT